jgi:hypothetical protein
MTRDEDRGAQREREDVHRDEHTSFAFVRDD